MPSKQAQNIKREGYYCSPRRTGSDERIGKKGVTLSLGKKKRERLGYQKEGIHDRGRLRKEKKKVIKICR